MSDSSTLGALVVFCIASLATPGPNNIIVFSSAMIGGVRHALPAWLGICVGHPLMALLFAVFYTYATYDIHAWLPYLKYPAAAVLLWIAFKIATTKTDFENRKFSGRLPKFHEMVLFQWINPKGWAIVIAGITLFTTNNPFLFPPVLAVIIFPSVGLWLLIGHWVGNNIHRLSSTRYINPLLGGLLALSVLTVL